MKDKKPWPQIEEKRSGENERFSWPQIDISMWKESVSYIAEKYTGLERDLNLCLINLHFSDYKKQ